jgi:hypothetical protein
MAQAFHSSHSDAPDPASWVRAQGGLREVSLWERMIGRLRMAIWKAIGRR